MDQSIVHRPQSTEKRSGYGPWTMDYGQEQVLQTGGPPWRIFIEEGLTACAQMARDVALAHEGRQTVRFFLWDPPAVSLGWKQPLPEWLSGAQRQASGLELVERPTGGGIAFHGSDVSIAVIVPRAAGFRLSTLMRAVCESARRLCESYGAQATTLFDCSGTERVTYCLIQSSPYAVMIGFRKVAGFALRRYAENCLIQGSLLVRPIHSRLADVLPEDVTRKLAQRAVSLSEAGEVSLTPRGAAERWAANWSSWWSPQHREESDIVGHALRHL